MGNILNRKKNPNELKSCLICWEKISTRERTECVRGKIVLHNLCEKNIEVKKDIVNVLIVVELEHLVVLHNGHFE